MSKRYCLNLTTDGSKIDTIDKREVESYILRGLAKACASNSNDAEEIGNAISFIRKLKHFFADPKVPTIELDNDDKDILIKGIKSTGGNKRPDIWYECEDLWIQLSDLKPTEEKI